MSRPNLTRRGLLAAAGSAACFALLRSKTCRAMAVPFNDFKSTTTTMFWVGEQSNADNAFIPNHESYWDKDWLANFGGVDDPVLPVERGREIRDFLEPILGDRLVYAEHDAGHEITAASLEDVRRWLTARIDAASS